MAGLEPEYYPSINPSAHIEKTNHDLHRSICQTVRRPQVAHRAGLICGRHEAAGIERGVRDPSLKNIRRVAIALGFPVKELFLFDDPVIQD